MITTSDNKIVVILFSQTGKLCEKNCEFNLTGRYPAKA